MPEEIGGSERRGKAIQWSEGADGETTIAAGYPKALLNFAVSRGADHHALIERAGICADALEDPDNRFPFDDYLALYEAAIDLTHEPALALQFGEAVRMQEISIVGLICEACQTTAEVAPQLNRASGAR